MTLRVVFKMDKREKIIFGVVVLALIALGGYLIFTDYVIPKYYSRGYNDGVSQSSTELILKINQEQTLPLIFQNGNQSIVQWIPISQVCGGA